MAPLKLIQLEQQLGWANLTIQMLEDASKNGRNTPGRKSFEMRSGSWSLESAEAEAESAATRKGKHHQRRTGADSGLGDRLQTER